MLIPSRTAALAPKINSHALLREQIRMYGADSDPVMSTSPTVTAGADAGAATLTGDSIDKADSRITWLSGTRIATSPADSRFVSAACLWRTSGTKANFGTGRRAVVEFDWYGQVFETRILRGATPPVWLLCDNQISANNFTDTSGASTCWLKWDFTSLGAAAWRNIRLEYLHEGMFGGLKLDTGGQIRATTAPRRLRLCVLGDSFTDGTGATYYATGYPYYLGRMLGFKNVVASGGGGTGYVTANPSAGSGALPNLADRIPFDGFPCAADYYIVAMGLNDASGVTANAMASLSALKASGRPVLAVLPWNPSAPTPRSGAAAAVAAETKAVCNTLGIKYFDPDSLEFTKSDATHPDQAGHVTLATWLAGQIKTHIGYA